MNENIYEKCMKMMLIKDFKYFALRGSWLGLICSMRLGGRKNI